MALIESTRIAVAGGQTAAMPSCDAGHSPIVFREEQEKAINQTLEYLQKGRKMLWDAKMRFGKTLCALEYVRRSGFRRVLILTHRPVVRDGWFDDFAKLGFDNCLCGSKARRAGAAEQKRAGETFANLEKRALADPSFHYIYFASMQDLRGSKRVNKGSRLDKNNEIFSAKWDLLIVDEAHEGISTKLGKEVTDELQRHSAQRTLYLSGTPYNLLSMFDPSEIYRWDYTMEQEAKAAWSSCHPAERNPYEGLARMNIVSYSLGRDFTSYSQQSDDIGGFSFAELFRVEDDADRFVHEADVRRFLGVISSAGSGAVYPFATEENRNALRHSLWVVPGVKSARCLAALLAEPVEDNVFRGYTVVNVAGEGDVVRDREDMAEYTRKENDALLRVKNAVAASERTITLTCGRLIMGVSVPEWTAVLMLSGGVATSAARFMQAVFRGQTPFSGAWVKPNCYAFDFAPDRTLTVIDQYINNVTRNEATDSRVASVSRFLKCCTLSVVSGGKVKTYDAEMFVREVNRAYSESLIRKGFRDSCLYADLSNLGKHDEKLLDMVANAISKGALTVRKDIRDAIAQKQRRPAARKKNAVDQSAAKSRQAGEVHLGNMTERNRRQKAIEILNQISARFPMMIYGTIDRMESLSFDSFIKQIDEDSWEEFMPKGVTMKMFMRLKHLYREDVFVATAKAIVERVQAADRLPVVERINRIADILSDFCYPDKETVLTPWRVVNMQLSNTLGGYDFWNERHTATIAEPRFVYHGEVTDKVFMNPNTRILDISSKTGLYALYMAYSIFKIKSSQSQGLFDMLSDEESEQIWADVIENNIFALCRTRMAELVTRRTLVGFHDIKANVKCMENLTSQVMVYQNKFIRTVSDGKKFWNANKTEKMKFDAIISNPPYQVNIGELKDNYGIPLYNQFVETAKSMKPNYISMIMPSRWFTGGRGLDGFRRNMLGDRHIRKIFDYVDSKECFPTVDVSGGVGYFLWDARNEGDCEFTNNFHGMSCTQMRRLDEFPVFVRNNGALSVIYKVMGKSSSMLGESVSGQTPFGFVTTYRGREEAFEGCITLKSSGATSYVSRDDIKKNPQWVDMYKVIFSKATCEHAGTPDRNGQFRVLSSLGLLPPGVVCTQSYLVGGVFGTETEAQNMLKYLKTKFVRYLMLQTITSQDLSPDKFMFVPMQDFSSASDIDWSMDIEAVEGCLYTKYGIDAAEAEAIAAVLKPMD